MIHRWLVVGIIGICVLGVFIMPQVDLPDTVINSTVRAANSPHLDSNGGFMAARTVAALIAKTAVLGDLRTDRYPKIDAHTDVHFVLNELCSLRC